MSFSYPFFPQIDLVHPNYFLLHLVLLTLLITFVKNRNVKRPIISKALILEKAKTLFTTQGYKATSIRKLASAIGISPTTIYLYYKDKAEIMHDLHREGFKLLNEQFSTLHHVGEPFERLKALGRCYINFSIEHPGLYEVMFLMKEPLTPLKAADETATSCEWEEGETAFNALISGVTDCINSGHFKGYDAQTLALLLWSNLHGLCALSITGHLGLLANKNKANDEKTPLPSLLKNSFESYSKILENI